MISRRTAIGIPVAGLLLAQQGRGQAAGAGSPLFTFRESFWLNLHHFLYVLGRTRNRAPDSMRGAVAGAPEDRAGFEDLPGETRSVWESAISTYAKSASTKDLIFDRHLAAVTKAIAEVVENVKALPAAVDADLREAMWAAAPVYRRVWWERHSKANQERVRELGDLLAQYGKTVAGEVSRAYQTQWPTKGFRVDVVAYANWAGAYSTADELIVLASTDPAMAGTQGLESVFHEAMHQWDDAMEARLGKIANRSHARVPRALSHSLIFYTAGYFVAKTVPGHKPYAVINGLWSGGGLVAMDKLDEFWRPYLDGKTALNDAIESLLIALS